MSRGRPLVVGSLMAVAALGLATDAGLRSVPATPALAVGEALPLQRASAEPPVVGSSAGRAAESQAAPLLETRSRERVELLTQQMRDEDADPARVAQALLDDMSDAELRSAIHELTNLDARDLDEIGDVRDYSARLATVAMRGLVTPAEPDDEPVPALTFSSAVDATGAPLGVAERFDGGPGERIYAHFSMDGYAENRVLVKWFRAGAPRSLFEELLGGSPRMLVFGRYQVQRDEAVSYVWASRAGWEPGRYVVELYDAADPLHKLAAGDFVVSHEPPAKSEPEPG